MKLCCVVLVTSLLRVCLGSSFCLQVMGWELRGDPHSLTYHLKPVSSTPWETLDSIHGTHRVLFPRGCLLILPNSFASPNISLQSHNCYFENKHQSEFQHQTFIPKLQTVLSLCIVGVVESSGGLGAFLSHKPQPLSCDLLFGEMQHGSVYFGSGGNGNIVLKMKVVAGDVDYFHSLYPA